MSELLDLVNKLSGVSFASLLTIVLYASWKDWWTWSRDRKAVEQDRDEWKMLALENLGIAKTAVDRLAKKAADHAARMEA